MAITRIFAVNLSVFIFLFTCAQRQVSASKDATTYEVHGGKQSINYQDISVIDLENEGRYRRQAETSTPSSNAQTTMATPQTTAAPAPTTTPNLDSYNIIHDDHLYYQSTVIKPHDIAEFWTELEGVTGHKTLSDSHRTAVTAALPFNFPFYGHLINNITIATGGFLYMSPFLHQWLTATQYVAPLMANFDTTIGNTSEVLYSVAGNGAKFVVEWRDVHLQDQNATGTFRFQAILHRNGSIFFVYKQLPVSIMQISRENHKVTVGLSDAFYIDTQEEGTKRRTIYEYHRVTLNTTYIHEGSIIIIHPKPTCNLYNDCETCVSSEIGFKCRWCGIIRKCSDSVDWHRQEWLDKGCVSLSGNGNCSLIPTYAPKKAENSSKGNDNGAQVGVIVVVVVLIVVLLGTVGGWFYYAYTHPTSASGMWLMEHRPSQMKAKMSNMKFWKRNGAAGDKYAVESTA